MKTKHWSVIFSFWFAAVVVLSGTAFGATNLYTGDTWTFLDGKKVMAAASEITLAKYPDCEGSHGGEKTGASLSRDDGTGECQDEGFVKVLTEKGKRGNRTLSLSFMLPYSTEEVIKLE